MLAAGDPRQRTGLAAARDRADRHAQDTKHRHRVLIGVAMIELQLIHEGGGRFRTATRLDLALATEHFGQGEIVEAKVGKKRSMRQHRWFFAMVKLAFDNQTTGPHFDDEERLRKWLLIQAGHCDVKRFEPNSITPAVAQWLRETYGDIDFTHDCKWIYAKTAKSMSFKAVGAEMGEIANKVIDVIMAEIVPGSTMADWEPFVAAATEPKKSRRPATANEARP